MTKLSFTTIKGFQTKNSLVDNFKKHELENKKNEKSENIEYEID